MKKSVPPKLKAESAELGAAQAGSTRLRLDLAFVGTGLCGWQAQTRGTTVQGLADNALRAIGHSGPRVVGCSRTDSGVHARLFSAHVDTALRRPLTAVLNGLNANLPPVVRIYRVSTAPQDYHARFSCVLKRYRYHLYTGPVVPPGLGPFVWPWKGQLDLEALSRAAALFQGERNFAAFTTADGRERNTLRIVKECRWERRGPLLILHVTGPSFLHRQVRCMAGAMIGVGTGRLQLEDLRRALLGETRGPQIPALPAQGLTLWDVEYPAQCKPAESAGQIPEGPIFPL
jgi:tRNA pseudouridine38-40 synthase